MHLWQFIVILSAGIALGIILHPLARMIESEGINQLLDSLARTVTAPFAFLGRTFGRKLASRRVLKDTREATTRLVDPREQQISDTAQTIRGLLLSLASVIQRTDQAASDSSQTLGDVRNTIDHMAIPDDLREVHSQLLTEIDRVISSNSTLKQELFHSREILATQRQQIDTLKTEVRIDGMTQLANRTCFDEKLLEMVRLWERYGDAFTLLIIDVDNFKEINDTHGHPGGDRVLKGIAYKIRVDPPRHRLCRPFRWRRVRGNPHEEQGSRCCRCCPKSLPTGSGQQVFSRRRRSKDESFHRCGRDCCRRERRTAAEAGRQGTLPGQGSRPQ